MVVIPGGTFTMGSTDAQKAWAAAHGGNLPSVADEAPQVRISIPSFALGEYDVTRQQYAEFVRETGYRAGSGCGLDSFKTDQDPDLSWENPGFPQSDLDPVVCVSWTDAQAYVAWVNQKAGEASGATPYHLPSEAEWEYAARAGTAALFWWGNDPAAAPKYAWYVENSGGRTQPVGMKPANEFGVFDIVGNVWQWVQDCYSPTYAHASKDGRAAETPPDCRRVDRGGSWASPLWVLRPSTRERNPADFRDRIMGFRIARTL